jgi:hypothetical protein
MAWSSTSNAQSWAGRGQLYVGACYQPVDRSPEQIDRDIAVMKRAGFNVVPAAQYARCSVDLESLGYRTSRNPRALFE